DDGKYAREEMIHELIMPMQKDSSEVFLDSCNLWLIDERLAFHNYLASDKTINAMPISDSASGKEPDLLSLKVFDNPILVNDQT
ncbi:ATP-binding protein, partial [Acinetobacter baumannii]